MSKEKQYTQAPLCPNCDRLQKELDREQKDHADVLRLLAQRAETIAQLRADLQAANERIGSLKTTEKKRLEWLENEMDELLKAGSEIIDLVEREEPKYIERIEHAEALSAELAEALREMYMHEYAGNSRSYEESVRRASKSDAYEMKIIAILSRYDQSKHP